MKIDKLEKQTHYDTEIKNNRRIDFILPKNEKNENIKLFNHLKEKEYTGFVKNYAWNYEDEVRIIANNFSNNEILKNVESIYLNFSERLIGSFKITTGPYFTKFKELNNLLKRYNDYKLKSNTSILFGNVNFNDLYGDIGEAIVDASSKIARAIKNRK